VTSDIDLKIWVRIYTKDDIFIEYQVKLQIVSLSLQIAVFGETRVSTFLQIGFNLFANPVSTFLQI
jgi:hypothetical protein